MQAGILWSVQVVCITVSGQALPLSRYCHGPMSDEINPYLTHPLRTDRDDVNEERDEAAPQFVVPANSAAMSAVLLLLSIALAIVSLAMEASLFAIYRGGIESGAIDTDRETALLGALNSLVAGETLFRVATACALLRWMYCAHRNLPALGHRALDSKPVWVVLCWFVPILNWFCPYQVMREIWWRSHPDSRPDGSIQPPGAMVGWWWGAWLVIVAMSSVHRFLAPRIETYDDAILFHGLSIGRSIVVVAAAALLIAIIFRINRMQRERARVWEDVAERNAIRASAAS